MVGKNKNNIDNNRDLDSTFVKVEKNHFYVPFDHFTAFTTFLGPAMS